jgi:hypothetical protein
MERLGFHVCVEDLEDELIRAVGQSRGDIRLSRRPGFVPLVAEPARLAGPEGRSTDAAVPGKWRPTQASLRTPAHRISRSRPDPPPTRRRTRCLRSGLRGLPPDASGRPVSRETPDLPRGKLGVLPDCLSGPDW